MFTPQHFTTIHGTILCSHHSILLQCTELFCVHATAFYKLQCTELSYVHTTAFYYNARNYIVFTPQRFTTMHGPILCSHHSVLLQCTELYCVHTTAYLLGTGSGQRQSTGLVIQRSLVRFPAGSAGDCLFVVVKVPFLY